MISNPWIALLITLTLCLLWMRLINLLTDKGVIKRSISRKVIHIGTGPIFILCWILFPDQPVSKYLAALVPLLIVLQLLLVGLGKIQDRTSILSMARSGEKNELLRGPLLYGLVFVLLTIFFWKSVNAIIPLMILSGGDGLADLVGSRIKSTKLPWAKRKTFVGSIAMILGGFVLSYLIILLVRSSLFPELILKDIVGWLLVINIAAAILESVSPSDWDNVTVPGIALILTLLVI